MTKASRVQRIELMMQAGEWPTRDGEEWNEVARALGVSTHTLAQDASEASRNLRRAMSDDELRAEIVWQLNSIAEEAREDKQFSAAVAALRTQLDARGLLSKRLEVTVSAVERMTPAEKARAILDDPQIGPLIRRMVEDETSGLLTGGNG